MIDQGSFGTARRWRVVAAAYDTCFDQPMSLLENSAACLVRSAEFVHRGTELEGVLAE